MIERASTLGVAEKRVSLRRRGGGTDLTQSSVLGPRAYLRLSLKGVPVIPQAGESRRDSCLLISDERAF